MKCTNRKRSSCCAAFLLGMLVLLTGCGGPSYGFAYDAEYGVSSFQVVNTVNASQAVPFASDLCVVTQDIVQETDADMSELGAALLCDVNAQQVIFAKNAHERLHPASLTKVMTALVAMKYGTMDQILTATDAVVITEKGAQVLGIKPGDKMTLSQALNIILMYSANDVAMLVAEGVGGSVAGFVELMNEEARMLGATNTHFSNPHGLTDADHYTTAYDMYLIFNEAIKYERFREIVHMDAYNTVYHSGSGQEKNVDIKTTNLYFRGHYDPPGGVTVVGGKTGTTSAAGHCLILLARDTAGNPYIAVIMKAPSNDVLYPDMSELLSEIGK